MGWRTIVVNTHSKLSYKNNHLIFRSSKQTEMIHLSEIDTILLETTDITITTMLMKRIVDEKILLIFCDDKRLPIAKIMPFYGRHDSSLQLTKQLTWVEDMKSWVWTEIIGQKILNQSNHLKKRGLLEKEQAILSLYNNLQTYDPTNREGHAARIYFNALFGNKFTRNQENDINAALNYGYTLLMSMFAREIVCMGCMTQFGLKHANQFNDFNLPSDIMEPFRIIIDEIVFDNKDQDFKYIKTQLFAIFSNTYIYNDKEMFLNNIISDYTKKAIKVLNNEQKGVPVFRI